MSTITAWASMDVAVEFDRDWDLWWWLGAVAVGVVAVLIAASVVWLWTLVDDLEYGVGRRAAWTGLALLTLAAAFTLLVLPGTMMRHVQAHEHVWFVVLGWVVAALVLFLVARMFSRGWPTWIAPVLIAVGVAFGGANDALQRFASWIPTTGAAVLSLVAVGALAIWLRSRES